MKSSDKLVLTQVGYREEKAPSGLKYADLVCEEITAHPMGGLVPLGLRGGVNDLIDSGLKCTYSVVAPGKFSDFAHPGAQRGPSSPPSLFSEGSQMPLECL